MKVFTSSIAFFLITVALYWAWVNATSCDVIFSCPTVAPVRFDVTQISTDQVLVVDCSETINESARLKCGKYRLSISGDYLDKELKFDFEIPYFGQRLKVVELLDLSIVAHSEMGKLELMSASPQGLWIAPIKDNALGDKVKAEDGMNLTPGEYSLLIPIKGLRTPDSTILGENIEATLKTLQEEVVLTISVKPGQINTVQLVEAAVIDKIESIRNELTALREVVISYDNAKTEKDRLNLVQSGLEGELMRLTDKDLKQVNDRKDKSAQKLKETQERYEYLEKLLVGDGVAHWQEWARSDRYTRARGGDGHYNRGHTIPKSTIREAVFGR